MISVRWPGLNTVFPQVEFRRLFRQISRPVEDGAEMVTAYTNGEVTLRSNRRLAGYHEAADMSGMQGVNEGDLVIHGLDILRGSVGVSDSDGAISSVCVICNPIDDAEPRYFAWLIRAQANAGLPKALARGVREGGADFRRWDTLAELPVLCPPAEKQKAIADFLDRETNLIDSLVEIKLKLVEVLVERQAEFERSVVSGLLEGSHVDRKMTGNSLIPNIPNNWKLIRARFLCSIDTGSSDTDESEEVGMYPFFVRSQIPNLSNRFVFDTEAVLTAGDGAGVGKVFHHYEGKFDAHQRVYVMHNFKGITGRYFFYFFSSFFGIAALDGSAKSTVDSVRRHMISELPVVVPPLDEQIYLTQILDDSRKKMESMSALLRQQVGRLRERREALISAAVTGELEIQEVAA